MGVRQVARDFYREGMANLLLDMMRANGKGAFVAQIVGDSDRPYLKQFEMMQIAGVKRVVAKTRNPMLSNIHGRMELMGQVASIENPKDRRAAIDLILTGDTDSFTDYDQTETNAIKWENKMLSQGVNPPVMIVDDHKQHFLDHKASLNKQREQFMTDDTRAPARRAHLDHMWGHIESAMTMHPLFAEWMDMPLPPPYRGMLQQGPTKQSNLAPDGAMAGGTGAGGGGGGNSVSMSAGGPVEAAGAEQPEPAQPAQSPNGPAQDQGAAA
jgi:predicted nicotinamide N-methyase